MKNKILLSYSAMDDLYHSPHAWLNKVMGLKKPESEAMKKGKETHAIIQAHVSGRKDPRLELDLDFPTAEYHCRRPYNDKYILHGYMDAINFASKTFLEVKSSTKKVWTNGDFDRSIQPAYYSYVSGFRKCFLISLTFDFTGLKKFYREFTDKDWERAKIWVDGAVKILEGDLKIDLIDGKCQGNCGYRENCHFL